MLSPAHVDELGRALGALEALVAVRLEERRGGTGPQGLLARPQPTGGSEGLPPAAVFTGDGPLAEVVAGAGLDVAEAVVLVAALAPEVDARFDALYGHLADRPDRPWLTGEVARTLAARTTGGRLRAAGLLAPTAPLLALGLLELDRDPASSLAGRLRPHPGLVEWLLGRPPGAATATSDLPAVPVTTVHELSDVVAAPGQRSRLAGLVARVRHRHTVVEEWGFGRAHDGVDGLVALFHGPSGTGKSMAAAAVGRAAGLPVWRVDLAALVSKYIGETEKQLARVFDRAAREQWLLVFDEADAVFGKRTEVGDAHDRYANQEVSYLLTRLERHPGVVVLTTNLLANIDEAFQRRLSVVIAFDEPGLPERALLWQQVVPPGLPVADDVDRSALARRYPLTGAQIRDAVLEAAYLAADDGRVVTTDHLVRGIRLQYEKAGRTPPAG